MAWTAAVSITIDHTKVGASDSTFFPLLVTGVYTDLRTVANGGSVTNANGYDIIFATDNLGASPIPFQRVGWSKATGHCEFWVKIATLSHTVDTVIYILYGNAAITTEQATPTTVWDTNFKCVYHLASGSAVDGNDSTAVNNGTAITATLQYPTKFGRGGISCANTSVTLPSMALSTFTISAWVYPTTSGSYRAIFGFTASSNGVEFREDAGSTLTLLKQAAIGIASSSGTLTINAWNHVAVTYNGTTATFYIGGAASGSGSSTQTFTTGPYYIGQSGISENWAGYIDELHISTSLRSADWILAEFNNQNSPSTFYTTALTTGAGAWPLEATSYSPFSVQGPTGLYTSFQTTPGGTARSLSASVSSAVTLLDTVLPPGTTTVAYSQTLTATGGVGAKTFAVTSGTLPTGLSLNASTGVISGTPSVAGSSSFTITATDTLSATGVQAFTLVIAAPSASGGGSFTFAG